MAKGIIVVDMPERCADCPVEVYSETFYGDEMNHQCPFEYKGYTYGVRENGRANWCPIKPMPKRTYHENYCDGGRYDKGWNDCLDEIFGRGK